MLERLVDHLQNQSLGLGYLAVFGLLLAAGFGAVGFLLLLGLPTTDRLLGLYDLAGDDSLYLRLLTRWLRQIEKHSALVCHPAARLDGADPLGNKPGQAIGHIKGEIQQWGKAVRESGAKADG